MEKKINSSSIDTPHLEFEISFLYELIKKTNDEIVISSRVKELRNTIDEINNDFYNSDNSDEWFDFLKRREKLESEYFYLVNSNLSNKDKIICEWDCLEDRIKEISPTTENDFFELKFLKFQWEKLDNLVKYFN